MTQKIVAYNFYVIDASLFQLNDEIWSAPALTIDAGAKLEGDAVVTAPITNAGTIAASTGTLQIDGGIGGKGTLLIDKGDVLALDGSVASTQTVVFAASTGTLILDTPSGFHAAISGFTGSDLIDFGGQVVTGFQYSTATHMLTVTGKSGVIASLTFEGSYTQSSFALTDNGQEIVDPAPSGPGPSGASDAYSWNNPLGGSWATAANWTDTTQNAAASSLPGSASTVTIAGGNGADGNVGGNETYTYITGTGAAAKLTIEGGVVLMGTVTVGGGVTLDTSSYNSSTSVDIFAADLELDGGASLSAGSLSLGNETTLQVGGASTLSAIGTATLLGASLLALDGSTVKLGGLIANNAYEEYETSSNTIAVDADSSIEVGTTGGAALGAITIDKGQSSAVAGTIDGNLVVNGTLSVEADNSLALDGGGVFDAAAKITGAGTLAISENSTLTLDDIDSAAIAFAGPDATLNLGALPTAAISGFAVGDVINVENSATGVSYKQTSNTVATLTFTNGGKADGTLTLDGNYDASVFHLHVTGYDTASITVQIIGVTPTQPSVILGTVGTDTLEATANGQVLTGLGGGDTLSANGFTEVDFKDTSADLNGSTITDFGIYDLVDLTDMKLATATVSYTPGSSETEPPFTVTPAQLTVTDGTHTATFGLSFATTLPTGYFATSTDGGTGTDIKYTVVNTDAYTFGSLLGGAFGTAGNWRDTTTSATATVAPSYGNAVTIAGGTAAYTDITGGGNAASLTTSGEVLLLGSVGIGAKVQGVSGTLTQTGTLALDGGAGLTIAGAAMVGGIVQVGDVGKLTVGGALSFSQANAGIVAIDGSTAQFAQIAGITNMYEETQYDASVIAVDASSSIEIGEAGGAAKGAFTVDSGQTVDLAGSIDGNMVVNGTLVATQSGNSGLTIAPFGTAAPSVTGAGTLEISASSILTLDGSDSAAILFGPPEYSGESPSETLALGTALPTGTISGFGAGDIITVKLTVTSLTYTQASSTAGTLTLLDGTTKLGTLSLVGSYSANQFQVSLSAAGLSSTITYSPSPSTKSGNQASSNSDSYYWENGSGGVWSNAGNWTDETAGTTPTTAPGVGNAVTIGDYGVTASSPQIISGSGSAASLSVDVATVFTGNISVAGGFSADGENVALVNGASIHAGSANVGSALTITGGSSLTATATTDDPAYIDGSISVSAGSTVQINVEEYGYFDLGGSLNVDGSSSFEIGTVGGVAAGAMTIDSGETIALSSGTVAARLVVNGELDTESGIIEGFDGTAGSVTGTGKIVIESGILTLDAADSAAIAFSAYSYETATLALAGPLPTGTISNFAIGDEIQIEKGVTGLSFKQTTSTQGTLTLTDGAATVGTLTLAGSFTGDQFHLDVAPATGIATISLETAPPAAGTATASTTKDAFTWTGSGDGSWTSAANWYDSTTSKTPGTVPGAGNAVTIAGDSTAGQYKIFDGTASIASLTVNGNVMFTSPVTVAGAVAVALDTQSEGTLALDAGGKLTAGSLAVTGTLEAGQASTVTVTGKATFTGGDLLALDGSSVQVGGLIGDGSNNVIAIDASSIMRIGTPGSAAAGTLTQQGGTTAAFTGSIFGSVSANGTLAVAAGGALYIDMAGAAETDPYESAPTIGGLGALSITEGATLGLGVRDTGAIQFAGPDATLAVVALPTGTISGFAAGDQIRVDQPVTGLKFTQVTATTGTLALTDGAAAVGTLALSGNYAGDAFHLDLGANGASAVITLQTLGIAATQPTLITGTAATDLLFATANNQTITGLGGGDTLSGGSFTGIDFKDLTANLNGGTIQDFATADLIDFTDMIESKASVKFTGGVLSVTDGTHSATLGLSFLTTPATGSFTFGTDGASGTKVYWT